MSGLIVFFILVAVICGSILVILFKNKKTEQSPHSRHQSEPEVAKIAPPLAKNRNIRELLSQADIGTMWIINHTDGHGRHTYEIFVRGVLSGEHLDNLQNQDVEEFDRRNPAHRRTLMAALNGTYGVFAKLVDGEDIGWAGAELVRKCNEWGIYPGGIKAAFGSAIVGRLQIPGSTGTNTALNRLQFILEPSKEAPIPLQRRNSQFFRPPA